MPPTPKSKTTPQSKPSRPRRVPPVPETPPVADIPAPAASAPVAPAERERAPDTGPVFAVSGNPPNFFESPHGKDRVNGPLWLREIGLDGLEISCTHGVNIPDDRADEYRRNAEAAGIRLFVHAPYYISLASGDEGIVRRSQERITASMRLAARLGATRVVFHPGGYPDKGPGGRTAAMARLIDRLREIKVGWDPAAVRLCAEIGGKVAALGSTDEIIEICRAVPWVSPCIDFAHLHARENGSLADAAAHVRVIARLERELGRPAVERLHCHVYSVAYNEKGERFHLRFEPDGRVTGLEEGKTKEGGGTASGPDVRHFLAAVRETGISPSVVCEGKDSQDIGARLMKRWWRTGAWGLGEG
jgi:deoxyribonuclease-4